MLQEQHEPLNSKDLLMSHQRTAPPNDGENFLQHAPTLPTNSQPL